jgi:hypothetical protein
MRKKIRLEMEGLAVDSFTTVGIDTTKRGTVRGKELTNYPYCEELTVSGPWPCLCNSDAAGATCDTTCNPDQCPCQSRMCDTVINNCR